MEIYLEQQAQQAIEAGKDPDCLPILREYRSFNPLGISIGGLEAFIIRTCGVCHIPEELGSCIIKEQLKAISQGATEAQSRVKEIDQSVQRSSQPTYYEDGAGPNLAYTNRHRRHR